MRTGENACASPGVSNATVFRLPENWFLESPLTSCTWSRFMRVEDDSLAVEMVSSSTATDGCVLTGALSLKETVCAPTGGAGRAKNCNGSKSAATAKTMEEVSCNRLT